MESLIQDLRYGVRMLLKSPGATAVAVLALGLGIGANAAMFSVINTLLLRPLPVAHSDRLVAVFTTDRADIYNDLSYPEYVDYRDGTDVFVDVMGHTMIHVALGQGGRNELAWGEMVTGNYFSVLGVRPALGRGFLPEGDRSEGAHPVTVIGHGLWRRLFASDPGVVGRSITINGQPFSIIGVAPEGFPGTKFALAMDLWVPVAMHAVVMPQSDGLPEARNWHWMETLARLKPGVTVEAANAALQVVAERLARDYPAASGGLGALVLPEREARFPVQAGGAIDLGASLAMIVVGLVLLVACANVANLLLARAAARRREFGVRLALGAGRWRLVRQLLTESLCLSVLGGAAGLLLAAWASDLLLTFRPPVPYTLAVDYAPDGRVILFTAIVSFLTAAIFGLAPALHASSPDLVPLLKGGSGEAGPHRRRPALRSLLVAGQVALSLLVLASGGLFLQSLRNAGAIDPGFQARDLLLGTFDVGLLGYTEERGLGFFHDLERRVASLPGVASAGLTSNLPLDDNWDSTGPIIADGRPVPMAGEEISAEFAAVSSGFFATLGVRLVRGREFTDRDDAQAAPVTIINDTLANRLWPGEDPIGKRLRIGGLDAPPRQVVGVARDGKYHTLGESPRAHIYRPVLQSYRSGMSLLVRTHGDPAPLLDGVRREVQALDSRLPVYGLKTLDEHLGHALWWTRMGAVLASSSGFLALVLAAVGLYGVMAYAVSQRTREIGIRMALGAGPRDVLGMVLRGAVKLALAGVGAGLLAALALGRVMRSLLYGVSSFEPVVFTLAPLLLLAVACLASLLPARRAARVDPMVALRCE